MGNITDINQLDKLKKLTKDFTETLLKDGNLNNAVLQTNLMAIQFGKSDPKSKAFSERQALSKNLSLINFQDCETQLRSMDFLKPPSLCCLTFL